MSSFNPIRTPCQYICHLITNLWSIKYISGTFNPIRTPCQYICHLIALETRRIEDLRSLRRSSVHILARWKMKMNRLPPLPPLPQAHHCQRGRSQDRLRGSERLLHWEVAQGRDGLWPHVQHQGRCSCRRSACRATQGRWPSSGAYLCQSFQRDWEERFQEWEQGLGYFQCVALPRCQSPTRFRWAGSPSIVLVFGSNMIGFYFVVGRDSFLFGMSSKYLLKCCLMLCIEQGPVTWGSGSPKVTQSLSLITDRSIRIQANPARGRMHGATLIFVP